MFTFLSLIEKITTIFSVIKMIKDFLRDKEEFNNPQNLIQASISGKEPDLMVDEKKEKLDNEFIGKAFFSLHIVLLTISLHF